MILVSMMALLGHLNRMVLAPRLLGVLGLSTTFWPFGQAKVGRNFSFGHSALSFGIGAESSFYYEIDSPVPIMLKILIFLLVGCQFLFTRDDIVTIVSTTIALSYHSSQKIEKNLGKKGANQWAHTFLRIAVVGKICLLKKIKCNKTETRFKELLW